MRAALDGLRNLFDPQGFDPARDERSFALAMADATATVLVPALVGALLVTTQQDLRVLPLVSRDPRPLLEQGAADLAIGFFPAVPERARRGGIARDRRPRTALCVRVRVRAARGPRARQPSRG